MVFPPLLTLDGTKGSLIKQGLCAPILKKVYLEELCNANNRKQKNANENSRQK
jgi:hypothetical protein